MFFGNAYWTAIRENILEEATRITESYERLLAANTSPKIDGPFGHGACIPSNRVK